MNLPMATFLCVFALINMCNARAPNIIFLMADDMGWNDASWQNDDQIHTPSLQFLKENGQTLDWFYAQSACSPTRASLMTGRYPIHHGIYRPISGSVALPTKYQILPQILKENGYQTHMVGKWHLGFYEYKYTPTFRGFDSFFGYYNGAQDYYTHLYPTDGDGSYDLNEANSVNCGHGCTKVVSEAYGVYNVYPFTERAISIIENHNRNEPLFLFLAYENPHSPRQAPQQFIDQYADTIADETRRVYAGMMSVMDESIGNITNALAKNNFLNDEDGNTLIIFMSDNGAPLSPNNGYRNGGSNWALRGAKGTTWEGGTRVNCLFYGTSDLINDRNVGRTYSQLMHSVDWFPTLLSAANIDYGQYVDDDGFDGIDHWNGLSQHHPSIGYDEHFEYRQNLYYAAGGQQNSAFRSFWMKLFPDGSGGSPSGYCCDQRLDGLNSSKVEKMNVTMNKMVMPSLYNLQLDPNEYVNIASSNEGIVDELWFLMNEMQANAVPAVQNDPNCPSSPSNPPIDPVLGIAYWEPWC